MIEIERKEIESKVKALSLEEIKNLIKGLQINFSHLEDGNECKRLIKLLFQRKTHLKAQNIYALKTNIIELLCILYAWKISYGGIPMNTSKLIDIQMYLLLIEKYCIYKKNLKKQLKTHSNEQQKKGKQK